MKNIPQRSCVICRSKKDKKDLIRIVRNKNGFVTVDETGKQDGRGAYICKDLKCLDIAIQSKKIEKSLETVLPEEFYINLKDIILKNEESKKVGGEIIG